MVGKSHCGCPVPIMNPPDFGWAVRLAQSFGQQPLSVPYPSDPGIVFPRVLTSSSSSRQGTSLGSEPAGACAWDVRGPRVRGGLVGISYASYGYPGLDYAASEIARLLARWLAPIPGIWLGPVFIDMPSGNLVLQLAVPPAGALDPIPIFTYNSQAAKANAKFLSGKDLATRIS